MPAETVSVEPLDDLQRYLAEHTPDVCLLLGPCLDCKNQELKVCLFSPGKSSFVYGSHDLPSCSPWQKSDKETYKDRFDRILRRLSARCNVFIYPSPFGASIWPLDFSFFSAVTFPHNLWWFRPSVIYWHNASFPSPHFDPWAQWDRLCINLIFSAAFLFAIHKFIFLSGQKRALGFQSCNTFHWWRCAGYHFNWRSSADGHRRNC